MNINIFNVKEKKENKIIVEEEKTKNPFLLFLKRHKKSLLVFIISLIACLILVTSGVALSIIQGSSDFDISYLDGSTDEITTNNNPSIKDEDVSEELLGQISKTNGVVLLIDTFLDQDNDVIYYFSDKTAIIITSAGKIYRISPINDNYGVDKKGKINENAKKVLVKSTTTTLKDETIITYYSDGTALVNHNNITLFVRNSNNIKLDTGVALNNIIPSGVSISTSISSDNGITMTTYTDKTRLVKKDNKMYIVNPNADSSADNNHIVYDANNIFNVVKEQQLEDKNTITYFENGSAIITDKDGKTIYVKKSGDITIKDKKVYEIVTNKYGYSVAVKKTSDNREITYFDNGAAIIKNGDGTKIYVEDSNEILYDSSNNISTSLTSSKQKSIKKTKDGYEVVNFENGKSQVIKFDGSSFIIDTNKLVFDKEGNITSNKKETDENKEDNQDENEDKEEELPSDEETEDPLEGMYVSDAENNYNDTKSIEDTTFIIRNTNNKKKKFRIVIEEISDYSNYNVTRLSPQFVKFQATIGDDFVNATSLLNQSWETSNNKKSYVIYDGAISAKSTLDVAITLYVDYENLDNFYQDTSFIGTIKVYVNE
jgi:hypothetical protein